MKFSQDFMYGLALGVLAVFIFNLFFKSKQVSGFTLTEAEAFFPQSLSREEATRLYQSKTQTIATDLAAMITTMVQGGRTTDEIITASHTAADQSNALNKAFASFQIRKAVTTQPAPPAQ